ncbi:glycosyltransferase [Candidatus Saccharibacteria bacterium]|nr:glycosyltransferase [Candidatus Saccharibacteria bacterium]
MKTPLISIIVPVYNVELYLPKCLNSIKSQTYSNLEIILIDDGSADNSGKLCDNFATNNSHIKVIHQKNQGLSVARNAGLKVATGDFVTFVDSDDTVSPEYVEYLYKLIDKYHAQLAIAATEEIFPDGHTINRGAGYRAAVYTTAECLDHMLAEDGFNVTAWSKLYARELFKGIKFPVGALHEDLATTYQTILKCDSVAYGPEPKYQYYQRPDSIANSKFSDKKLAIITFTDQMCDTIHKKFPENEELDWTLKKRRMHARFSVLRLMTAPGVNLTQAQQARQQEIVDYLKSHQDWVLQNPKASSRDRTAMKLLKFGGLSTFRLGWRFYTKLK